MNAALVTAVASRYAAITTLQARRGTGPIRMGRAFNRVFLLTSTPSVPGRVTDDAPHGLNAVFPADLLAFMIGTAVIADRHLNHAPPAASDLGGHLRLEA